MLDDLIPLVNKLQDIVFNTIGSDTIDLPQIVVVGSQSSGKSSVLENIVGRDFLPRGSGIVTRRPLILQLINTCPPTASDDIPPPHSAAAVHEEPEWAEFLHLPGRRYSDFAEVRREIETETSRIAGLNKGINRLPINLKIYSPHVLNLTLVDLPGLTKIPIGDQPTDIEKQVRNLIVEYIAKPNSIILAVTPANIDLVNSEGLKLARQVDPSGKRTIGVLTKLDLMDQGTNALEILSGRVYPLKLGFIGVVNRSQHDIQANKSLPDALRSEEDFFRHHPAYRNIAHRCGTQYLAKSLNQILIAHIRERLPDIKARLNTLMGQTQQELAAYGDQGVGGVAGTTQPKGLRILQLMTRFSNNFIASIDGTLSEISTKELCGGARIYYIFNSVFGNALDIIDPTTNLTVHDIRTAIRNSTGPRPSLFVPELAFDLLVRPQIRLLEPPSQRCVELVYEELMKICHSCGDSELTRYPRLQGKLIEVISELLRERLGPTSNYVESLISIQRAYINTNHPKFLGGAGAVSKMIDGKAEKKRKDQTTKVKAGVATNGTATPEPEHAIPGGRTLSYPRDTGAVNQDLPNGAVPSLNGPMAGSATSTLHTSANARDSFLNHFFGNDGTSVTGKALPEPNFTGSFRRPDVSNLSLDDSASIIYDEPALTEREQMETELIRNLITSYFNIVREIIQDQVPKAVMHLLVNFTKESVSNRLVSELYKEDLFDDLLHEDESLAQERTKCEHMLQVYKDASAVISGL
ncbi:Dynamin-related GTPase protein [Saitoella coloradoensis]